MISRHLCGGGRHRRGGGGRGHRRCGGAGGGRAGGGGAGAGRLGGRSKSKVARKKNEMAMIKPWLRAIFFSRFIFATS